MLSSRWRILVLKLLIAFINLHLPGSSKTDLHFPRFSIPISKKHTNSYTGIKLSYLFISLCRRWRLQKLKIQSTGKFAACRWPFFVGLRVLLFSIWNLCVIVNYERISWCIVMMAFVEIWDLEFEISFWFVRSDLLYWGLFIVFVTIEIVSLFFKCVSVFLWFFMIVLVLLQYIPLNLDFSLSFSYYLNWNWGSSFWICEIEPSTVIFLHVSL